MPSDWARNWVVPCPKCGAPIGAPCADMRSYDLTHYGARVHRERIEAKRRAE